MLKIVLFLLVLVILIAVLIQTAPVQHFIRGKAVAWLEKKLNTKVAVDKIYIGFPKNVIIEGIYVEDLQKDTLLYAGKLKTDIALFKLLRNKIEINDVTLQTATAKIKRELPDTVYNFQFILDAFGSGTQTTETPSKDTTNNITIKSVSLDKIRLVYKDAVTGNDVESMLEHFETKIGTFDLAHADFDISRFKIDGLTARVYQSKPLVQPEPEEKDMADAKKPLPLKLKIKEIALDKINLDYKNDVSSFYTNLDLDKLLVYPDQIDLANRIIDIDEFVLDGTTASIRLGKTQGAKIVEKETEQEVKSQAESGWQLKAAAIRLNNNNFRFDNDNTPAVTDGIDFAHINAGNLTFHLDNFFFSNDSVSGKIKKGSLAEKSGFELDELQADFTYGTHGTSINNLQLKTPGTELKREAAIQYASLESLKNDAKNMGLAVDLRDSKVQVKDVLVFVPSLRSQPAFANPNTTWYINAAIHGTLGNLEIDEFRVSGLTNTKAAITGSLSGIPETKKLKANLTIHSLQSSRRDVLLFLPRGSLPTNITIPDRFNLTGTVNGGTENFETKLQLQTSLGEAAIAGNATAITDKENAGYDFTVTMRELELGTILQQKELLGPLTATISIKGKGLDKTTADAAITGVVQSAVVKNYNYRDLKINGSLRDQHAQLIAAIQDPNIHVSLDLAADLSSTYPAIRLNTSIDSIKLAALHLTTDSIIYRGKINADFPVSDPDSLNGSLYVTESLLVKDGKRIQIDTIRMLAGSNDTGQFIVLNSDIVQANLQGKYKLTELGSVFQRSIEPYFATGKKDSVKSYAPYDFTLHAALINKPLVKTFLPDLNRLDSVYLQSHFSDRDGWDALLKAAAIEIGENKLNDLAIRAGTKDDELVVNAHVQQLSSGKSIALFNTTIDAAVKDNNIDFGITTRDKADKIRYALAGLLEQPQTGTYRFSLKPDSLLLNYDKWSLAAGNSIEIGESTILADSFVLSKEGQQLSIHSVRGAENPPLEISFTNFRLKTLTGFVQPDSTLADGLLNGKVTVADLPKAPLFTGDLTINELSIKNDTVGNIVLRVNNKEAATYAADIVISGRGNDVHLTGNYYAKQADNNFDLLLDIKRLPLTTVQAFSQGAITKASGTVNGRFTVKGNFDRPKVNGDLNFAQAVFSPTLLNNLFQIDNEKIQVNEEGILFSQFAIKDSAGNNLTLNGTAATTNFTNYKFNFTVRARDFRALNSSKKDNKLFYGQLYFNTNLRVNGTEKAPVVDGSITINEKTKMTIVLPQPEPGVADRQGIVEFVDMDAPANDSLFLAQYDSLNTFSLKGIDVAANIEIKKEAELTLIIDEGNGDFLNVHGEALLTAGVDPSGKITLAGSYELEEGTYQLTFNLLRRKFNIQKGSKIIWTGEPTAADVNITAAYEANTAPLDLVKNELAADLAATERNKYLQRLPFQLYLKMKGKLLQPQITFDIVLPDDKEYNVSPDIVSTVRTKLELLRQDEGELNKQVFALLLLNRFVGENPFNSSGGGPTAETFVRQSASKLLTEQLNRLAENLVQGVDLNFDVESSEDYSTGQRAERTDLNVGISKRLLNDRLTVTVGSNFELEGPQNSNQKSNNIAGNVALNYRLSKDGRYVLRAYRKNEYQGVLDGYIIETGVGFIITLDYNRFRQIFQKKKERRPRGENQEQKKEQSKTAGKDAKK